MRTEVSYKQEILELLKEGLWVEQIARKLGLSKEVVICEVDNITVEQEYETRRRRQ